MGWPCSTYGGYRNKNGVQEIINNKGGGLDLSCPGQEEIKHCTEQGNFFRSSETTGCFLQTLCSFLWLLFEYLFCWFVIWLVSCLLSYKASHLVKQSGIQSDCQSVSGSASNPFIQSVSPPFIYFDQQSVSMSVSRLVLINSRLYGGCHWRDFPVIPYPDKTYSQYELLHWLMSISYCSALQ